MTWGKPLAQPQGAGANYGGRGRGAVEVEARRRWTGKEGTQKKEKRRKIAKGRRERKNGRTGSRFTPRTICRGSGIVGRDQKGGKTKEAEKKKPEQKSRFFGIGLPAEERKLPAREG